MCIRDRYVDAIACVNRKVFVHDRPENGITDETLTEMYGREAAFFHHGIVPHIAVSYTHLDVYKRQLLAMPTET